MIYEKLFQNLNKSKIKYLVVGGIAVNLYGYPRVTGDLDLMLSLEDKDLEKFVHSMKGLGYKPKIPVKIEELAHHEKRTFWIKEKNMVVFSLYHPNKPMELVDILIENQINFKKAYQDKVMITAGSVKIPVISLDDLIKLKKKAGRERDALDIRALKEIKKIR